MIETKVMAQPAPVAIILLIAAMYTCIMGLMGCHKLAKSIFSAS
jgi:hypothetical protein